jgi:PHD/YefM family antitoxin component YafN of YafNO toxin-antitoxin module
LHEKAIISSGEYNVYSGILMAAVEQYVIDENGNKVAVILPLTEYQHLKEDLHDLAMVAERRDEGTISLSELKKRVM